MEDAKIQEGSHQQQEECQLPRNLNTDRSRLPYNNASGCERAYVAFWLHYLFRQQIVPSAPEFLTPLSSQLARRT